MNIQRFCSHVALGGLALMMFAFSSCAHRSIAVQEFGPQEEFLEHGPGFSAVLTKGFCGAQVSVSCNGVVLFSGIATTSPSTGIAGVVAIETNGAFQLKVTVDGVGSREVRIEPLNGHQILIELGDHDISVRQNKQLTFFD